MQTDNAGNLEQSCASLPYGDGETCGPAPTENLYTGKERDSESGNDYFGARYYAGTVGRFLSPDPLKVSQKHLLYPQRWNAYAYVQNDSLSAIDPDGWDDFKIFDNFSAKDAATRPNWNAIKAAAERNGHTVEIYGEGCKREELRSGTCQ